MKFQALNCRDGGGRLPLHIALDRQTPSLSVVRLLVRANPAAASARRGEREREREREWERESVCGRER